MMRLFLSSLVLSTLIASAAHAEVKELSVDTASSQLSWVGRKILGAHDGTVRLKSGAAKVDGSTLVGGSFEVDMSSIAVRDITDPKDNSKLSGHLKSDDFFNVAQFPTVTFTITKAEAIQGAAEGASNYNITGDLKILGLAKSISFPARVSIDSTAGAAKASATVVVDRTNWGIRYGSGKFFDNLGDRVIKDTFEVKLDVVARG